MLTHTDKANDSYPPMFLFMFNNMILSTHSLIHADRKAENGTLSGREKLTQMKLWETAINHTWVAFKWDSLKTLIILNWNHTKSEGLMYFGNNKSLAALSNMTAFILYWVLSRRLKILAACQTDNLVARQINCDVVTFCIDCHNIYGKLHTMSNNNTYWNVFHDLLMAENWHNR